MIDLGELTALDKIFYLSFKSEGHGQRLQEIGSVGRIQIVKGF